MIDVLGTALDYTLLFIDHWALLVVVTALAFAVRTGPRAERGAMFVGRAFARPIRAYAMVAVLSIVVSLSITAIDGLPLPLIHDDYAVLLGGKMFASGYAAYPTHPMWQWLETPHVLQVPSYAPKYPPGQSLLLALGIVVFRTALVGSWLAAAAACVAMMWALRALLPFEWAFAGGIAAALHPVMIDYANAYRGGGLAALGGALLFGATARLLREPKHGAIAGLGLALLALTRPYEGVILAVGCAIALLIARARPWRALVPMLLVASLGLLVLALNNRAVTGSALRMPWVEYARQYDPAPPFAWQRPTRPVPQYRNEEFRYLHGVMFIGEHRRLREPGGLRRSIEKKFDYIANTISGDLGHTAIPYLWPLLFAPLLVLRRESMLPLIVAIVFLFAPLSLAGWLLSQYLAPAAAPMAALWMIGFRAIAQRRPWLAALIAVVFAINSAYAWKSFIDRNPGAEVERRRLMVAAGPGKHLFLVAPEIFGIVANEPDIDRSRVVWARDRGDNGAVRAYFRDRRVWRVGRGEGGRLEISAVPSAW